MGCLGAPARAITSGFKGDAGRVLGSIVNGPGERGTGSRGTDSDPDSELQHSGPCMPVSAGSGYCRTQTLGLGCHMAAVHVMMIIYEYVS